MVNFLEYLLNSKRFHPVKSSSCAITGTNLAASLKTMEANMAVSEAEQQVAGMFWIWYTLLSLFLANYFMVSVFGPAVKFLHFKCVFLGKAVCSISW